MYLLSFHLLGTTLESSESKIECRFSEYKAHMLILNHGNLWHAVFSVTRIQGRGWLSLIIKCKEYYFLWNLREKGAWKMYFLVGYAHELSMASISACYRTYTLLLFFFKIIYKLTNSMEHSPSWEANSYSGSQEIPCLLWNLRVHYCVHSSLLRVHILSQMNPVHTFPLSFPKIQSVYLPISA